MPGKFDGPYPSYIGPPMVYTRSGCALFTPTEIKSRYCQILLTEGPVRRIWFYTLIYIIL